MPKKNDGEFWKSARNNKAEFMIYYDRLVELAISTFKWENLPDEIDERFLELALFTDGHALFFNEPDVGYAVTRSTIGGQLNIYNIPTVRQAYASNGFSKVLTNEDSVIIYNNRLHTSSQIEIERYATKLANLDRIVEVNANAQKTPVLITCSQHELMTMKNLYLKYDGNQPVIYGDKGLNPSALKVLKTDAPYIADKISDLKTQTWNEALTYLGIANINVQKRERMITDEVTRNMGGTIASRRSRLYSRQQACEQINNMFPGLNVKCDFAEDFQEIQVNDETIDVEKGDNNEQSED